MPFLEQYEDSSLISPDRDGRIRTLRSAVPAGLGTCTQTPGIETPGYSQRFLRNHALSLHSKIEMPAIRFAPTSSWTPASAKLRVKP
jgi:hypothetical protein